MPRGGNRVSCEVCGKGTCNYFQLDKHVKKEHSFDIPNSRRCLKCFEVKELKEFYKTKSQCRKCIRISKNKYSRSGACVVRYNIAKDNARKKGQQWDISKEFYLGLSNKKCVYCQSELPKMGGGMDRVDNRIGYIEENVAPCCSICNKIKGSFFTYEEMLEVGKVIRKIREYREMENPSHKWHWVGGGYNK